MQRLSDHTATLNQFIQLFDIKNDNGYKMGGVVPAASCYDTDAIADINQEHEPADEYAWNVGPSRLTVFFELAENRLSIDSSNQHRHCIKALIDSCLDHQGLLFSSYKEIASDYLPILGKLELAELHRARTFLLHNSPVLGLGSRTSAEFKWVVAHHFAVGEFKRDDDVQNYHLGKCFTRLLEDSALLKIELAPLFVELSRLIYIQAKASRQLSALKTSRLLKCRGRTAECLCRIYNALPNTPLN